MIEISCDALHIYLSLTLQGVCSSHRTSGARPSEGGACAIDGFTGERSRLRSAPGAAESWGSCPGSGASGSADTVDASGTCHMMNCTSLSSEGRDGGKRSISRLSALYVACMYAHEHCTTNGLYTHLSVGKDVLIGGLLCLLPTRISQKYVTKSQKYAML